MNNYQASYYLAVGAGIILGILMLYGFSNASRKRLLFIAPIPILLAAIIIKTPYSFSGFFADYLVFCFAYIGLSILSFGALSVPNYLAKYIGCLSSIAIIAVALITISELGEFVSIGAAVLSPIYAEPFNKELNCQIFGSGKDNADYDVILSEKLKQAPFIEKQMVTKKLHIVQTNAMTLSVACGRACPAITPF